MRVVIVRRLDGAEVEIPKILSIDHPWWSRGFGACDCNRHTVFNRAMGISNPGSVACDRVLYAVRVEVDGQPAWSDF